MFVEVFPESDFRAAAPGTSVERVYRSFGREPSRAISASNDYCVRFQYDPELFTGSLVILARGKLISDRWLVESEPMPEACSRLLVDNVDLTGWWAAGLPMPFGAGFNLSAGR